MNERLVDFLYVLARDELPVGAIEDLMWDHVDTEPSSYCNEWLEGWARDLAKRLTDDSVAMVDYKHMFRSADGKERYWIDGGGNKIEAPRKFVGSE